MGEMNQRQQYAKGGIGKRYWDRRDREVFKQIPAAARNILDLGCGEGITLEKLIREFPGRNIQGIDFSYGNLTVCTSKFLPVRWGDACHLDIPDRIIDCCLFLEVIEHLAEPMIALCEIERILRPGGLVLILFPNDFNFFLARLFCFKFSELLEPRGHVRQWTAGGLWRLVECLDFRVEKVKFLPNSLFWLHCLMVVRKVN